MIKRLMATFFLIVFSFSISVFSAEVHYCKGKIADISFFGDAQCACPSKADVQKESGCKMHKKKGSCCETKELQHDKGDDFENLQIQVESKLKTLAVALVVVTPYIFYIDEQAKRVYSFYNPPDPEVDRQILFQTFII